MWEKLCEIRTLIASIKVISPKNIKLYYKKQAIMNGLSMLDY